MEAKIDNAKASRVALAYAKDVVVKLKALAAAENDVFMTISAIAEAAASRCATDSANNSSGVAAEAARAHSKAIYEISAAAAKRSANADTAAEDARQAVVSWDKTVKASAEAAQLAEANYASHLNLASSRNTENVLTASSQ